jgi:hypothetical protein
MRPSRSLAWVLFVVYALWLLALQGLLARPHRLGAWTPDLGLVLLVAWSARLGSGRAALAALLVAFARTALGADAPVALAAGYLGVVLLHGVLRTGIEVDRGPARAVLAGLLAFGFGALVSSGPAALLAGASTPSARLVPFAVASALAAALLGPLLVRLPGLRPLRGRR